MLPRVLPAVRTVLSASRVQATSVRAMGGYNANFKSEVELAKLHGMTLNDLPRPSGSWKEANSKQQMQLNMQLGGALLILGVTFVIMQQSGTIMYHDVPNYKKLNIDPSKPLEE